MSPYEIIADPQDYGIDALVQGLGTQPVEFPGDERRQWATEVGQFTERLSGLTEKAQTLQRILEGENSITATPSSLKTLKIQLFTINAALDQSLAIADRLEAEIVPR